MFLFFLDSGAKIINEPFTCCVLPDFLQPNEFIQELKNEIDEVDVEIKLSDLYQFKQVKRASTSTNIFFSLIFT